MKMKNKILIFGWFDFPFGTAAASRIRTISKGLSEQGFEVSILTTARIPFRQDDQNNAGQLTWGRVKYKTVNNLALGGKRTSLKFRILHSLKAICKSWLTVYKLIKSSEVDRIIIYGRSGFSYSPIVLLARLYSVPLFFDVVEWYPPSQFKFGLLNPFFYNDWLARKLPLVFSKGVIAISHYIAEQYTTHQIPCLILPSIFDYDLSSKLDSRELSAGNECFRLIYAGTCKIGDGIENLLEAVKIVFLKGCPIQLDILGTDGFSGPSKKYRQLIEKDKNLSSRVRFLGRVSDENYLSTLCTAHCLVLPRPDCQTVRAAFPTRLPEFLSTGRPVLTTYVPDIPRYLDAGIHAEILTEDTSNALADGILRLWKNPARAKEIGRAGRRRGLEVFDYRSHMIGLAAFINTDL